MASLPALVSPSLLIPIVGKAATGGARVVGGIAGGAAAVWLGHVLGQWAGEASYDFVIFVSLDIEMRWSIVSMTRSRRNPSLSDHGAV
jgi:hypothetical protein